MAIFIPNYILPVLAFGIVFAGIAFGHRALRCNTTRPDLNADQVVFQTSSSLYKAQIMLILIPLLLGLLVLPGQIADVHAQTHTASAFFGWSSCFAALYLGTPLGLIALLLTHSPGPQEICLDKRQRTYNLRFGTHLKPQRRSGSWQDIEGLLVCPIRGKGQVVSYSVYISWREGLSGGPSLGLSRHQEQAEWLAEKIANELGLQSISSVQSREGKVI